jgi:hypothetical protein
MPLTISWSDIEKFRNIGLYQPTKQVWVKTGTERVPFGEGTEYTILDY